MNGNSLKKYQQSQYQFKNNVLLCNLLDKDFFLDFYKKSEILNQFEREGKKLFPSFAYLMEDLFYSLYKITITVKEEEEINTKIKTHRIIMKQVLETTDIQKLRRRTKGNIINSYHALYYFIQWFLEFIKDEEFLKVAEERNEISQEIQDIQDKMAEQEQREEELEEEIESFEEPYDEMKEEEENQKTSEELQGEKENKPQSQPGQIETAEEQGDSEDTGAKQEGVESESYQEGKEEEMTQTVAGKGDNPSNNELDQNLKNIDGGENPSVEELELERQLISKKIEGYQEKLKELEKQDEILLEDYEKSIQEQDIEEVTNKAIFIIEDLEDKVESFGAQSEEMKSLSFDLIMKLSETFRNPKLEEFLKKIGRKRTLARKGQRKKQKKFQGIHSSQTLSDDLNNITEDEYLNLGLGIEALEIDFYNRYLNARLSTWEGARVEKKRKGPIIVCYDGSASMEGERIEETKAHLLAFIEIAKKQKRRMLTIQFSSAEDELYIVELEPRTGNLQKIVDIIEGFIGKGTDFKRPLTKSLEYIIQASYKEADIIFMTDGESSIDKEFKREFIEYKEKYKFKLYTVLINYRKKEYKDIQRLSDEVYYVNGEEWEEGISEKIFSI